MRRELPRLFPGAEFFFQPADMMTQILNFGLPAAIDVQITGNDLRDNYQIAARLMKQIRQVRGTVDTHIQQRLDLPAVSLAMDRTQLQQLGLSASDVAQDLLVSTAGTTQTSPAFWLNSANGAERPGEQYQGTIARTANAIDTTTRTMQVEVRVPNPKSALIPGSYVQVQLPIDTDTAALVVPNNVLLFRPDGPRVALVDGDGRVHLSPVKLGTDFGKSVAVLSGPNGITGLTSLERAATQADASVRSARGD